MHMFILHCLEAMFRALLQFKRIRILFVAGICYLFWLHLIAQLMFVYITSNGTKICFSHGKICTGKIVKKMMVSNYDCGHSHLLLLSCKTMVENEVKNCPFLYCCWPALNFYKILFNFTHKISKLPYDMWLLGYMSWKDFRHRASKSYITAE